MGSFPTVLMCHEILIGQVVSVFDILLGVEDLNACLSARSAFRLSRMATVGSALRAETICGTIRRSDTNASKHSASIQRWDR